jgi:predicted DCC family thiol-disulfide oxidoreductase YuxK
LTKAAAISSSFIDWPLIRGLIRAFSIDYRTLALFRVCIGSIIFIDLMLRSRDFTAFFTDQGVIPRRLALNWWPADGTLSLYFINGGALFNAALVLLALLLALALIVGYKTRLVTVLSWIMLVSLHHRTGILSHGGEDLLRLLLFWGMFLPLGARFSFDSAMETSTPYPKQSLLSIATFGILMQAMYVYWVGALLKTGAEWNIEHSAIFYALNAEQFATGTGHWVLVHLDFLLPYLTQFVLVIEKYGPLLMLAPFFLLYLRLPILSLLICMHIGFAILLNVGFFPFISITSLLLFVPPEIWRAIRNKWVDKRSEKVWVYYDEHCDFCLKVVMLLKVMLILPELEVKPAQQDKKAGPLLKKHNSWVIQKPDGNYLMKWSAIAWLFGRSCLFFWLKWPLDLMVKLKIGDKFYHYIGNRRISLGVFTAKFLPWRTSNGKITWLNQILAASFFLFILQINLFPILGSAYVPSMPKELKPVKSVLGLWQKWNMFAPYPMKITSWPVYEGTTRDKRKVDIFRQEFGAPSKVKPDNILGDYTNHRWRKFNSRLYLKKFKYFRRDYVKFECREWNRNRPRKDQITKISLAMGRERTLKNTNKETSRVVSMGSFPC